MKILFDFQSMSGGAPRSQLAHMLAMKKAGYEVVATIGQDAELLARKVNGVKIIEVESFSPRSPIKNLKLIPQWIGIIQREQPDIIHANNVAQFLFLAVVSDLTGVPLVFAQSGGVAQVYLLKPMYGKTPITYSLENNRVFIKSGFTEAEIHVITNRIPYSAMSSAKQNPKHPLRLLATGNIKSVTISGLLSLLHLLHNNVDRIRTPFVLQLAGQDVSKGKIYHDTLMKQIACVNHILETHGRVEHLGWVEDITTLQAEADVCIGKGRSVIQPAMHGKICFVLAESGRLTRVTRETFENLYEFNFSGRGSQLDSTEEFLALFASGDTLQKYKNEAQMVETTVREAYLDELVTHKLEQAYRDALARPIKPSRVAALFRILRIYSEGMKKTLSHGKANNPIKPQ